MTITMKIEELRRLEAEATPGEWEATEAEPNDGTSLVIGGKVSDLRLIADCQIRQDAALIVAMRNALPELLKALEALQRIESTACEGLEDGGYREALIEIKYATRKALPPHGGVDVG